MRKFKITVEGKSYEVSVEEQGVGAVSAQAVSAPVVSAPVVAQAPVPAGGTQLEAPMPGMIVGFKVADGASVKKGDVVLVLEAMKMENDITAPADGVFKSVATKGATVNTGDVLAVIS